jgi:hypothetical protein
VALKTEAGPRLVLAAVSLGLAAATAGLELPRASRGEFWGDGATYYAMAWSLARDLDLRFDAADLARIRAEYPNGPQGLFLKRASGGLTVDGAAGFPWLRRVRPDEGRLYYAKAFAHPAFAAPLVALLGTRGLTLANGLLLSAGLWVSFFILKRRGVAPWTALSVAVALLLLTVTPVYLVWPAPEILGLALISAGLAAWAAGRPLLAAVLLGVAGYLKPPNVLLATPLFLDPLLPSNGEGRFGNDRRRRLVELSRRVAVAGAAAACLYGLNAAATGELNYQGGERKTFYGRFPFDETGATFASHGVWMATNQLGPLVEGRDDARVSEKSGPARKRTELLQTLALNLGYFWLGRFGGVLAYFPPALLALLLFVLRGPRRRSGWLALAAIVASWLAYISIIPDNWYGGGGTVGNRYFLSLLPCFLLLVPARRHGWVIGGGLLGAGLWLLPILGSPIRHSLRPGEHAMRGSFALLPAELTMLNDLSLFTEAWRKKRPFGFVGNAERHADPDAFLLYFMDDGTYGKEEFAGRAGFWLRAGARAEVVVRAFDLAPVERLIVRLQGGPLGDQVDVRLGWHGERMRIGPGQTREIELPAGRGVPYYDTYLYVLKLRSRRGAELADGRPVSAFVEPRLVVGAGGGR